MMMDMGQKHETGGECCPTQSNKETKISYPSFSISGDKIPSEIGDMKNGEKCRCEIIVRKIGDNIDTYAKGEPRRIEVEIHKLGYSGDAKIPKDEYENMSDEEKDKADEQEVMSADD